MSNESPCPSLAVLMDNARTEITAGRAAGLEPQGLLVNELDFAEVMRATAREQRNGYGPRLYGLDLIVENSVEVGHVRLALPTLPQISLN
jgi:hypothetical protein